LAQQFDLADFWIAPEIMTTATVGKMSGSDLHLYQNHDVDTDRPRISGEPILRR
jgi:hypothetical protein